MSSASGSPRPLAAGIASGPADRNGMEVEVELAGVRKEKLGKFADPAAQQLLLVTTLCLVGVVGHVALLGQDVETSEETERPIELEGVDVASPFLVEQLEQQQTEQSAVGGHHHRTWIAGVADDRVEPDLGQEWQEDEDAGPPGFVLGSRRQRKHPGISDLGRVGDGGWGRLRRSASVRRHEKGGVWPWRH